MILPPALTPIENLYEIVRKNIYVGHRQYENNKRGS